MGYSNFKRLKQVTQKFGLDAKTVRLFPDIKSVSQAVGCKKL